MSSEETLAVTSLPSDEEEAPPPGTLRLSMMPRNLRTSAVALFKEMDINGDGELDEAELAMAFNALKSSRDMNRRLARLAAGLALSGLLLVGAVFGTSIAAAYLAKDTRVGGGGVLRDKSTGKVVRTAESTFWSKNRSLADMTNDEILELTRISLLDGKVHFKVKGHVRPFADDGRVVLLVEGGTITYDQDGIASATGDALAMLNLAFNADFGGEGGAVGGKRRRMRVASVSGGDDAESSSGAAAGETGGQDGRD